MSKFEKMIYQLLRWFNRDRISAVGVISVWIFGIVMAIVLTWLIWYMFDRYDYCTGLSFDQIYADSQTYHKCKEFAPEVIR